MTSLKNKISTPIKNTYQQFKEKTYAPHLDNSSGSKTKSINRHENERYLVTLLVILDLTAIAFATLLFTGQLPLSFPMMMLAILPFVFRENKLYWRYGQIYKKIWLQLGQMIRSYFFMFVVLCVFKFSYEVFMGVQVNPVILGIYFVTLLTCNIVVRLLFAYSAYAFNKEKVERFAIIGNSERATYLAHEIQQHPKKMKFIGFISDEHDKSPTISHFNLGALDSIENIIFDNQITKLVVVMEGASFDELLEVTDKISRLPVEGYIFNEELDVIRKRYWTVPIGSTNVSAIGPRMETHSKRLVKRIFDVLASLTILVVISPIFLLLAMIVKLTSNGPVFYISERARDKQGGVFNLFKFRSMYVRNKAQEEAERQDGIERGFSGNVIDTENTKVVPKGAITPFGYFLRKSSLDELPQLINVLKGDMSLVGPRPDTPYEFKRYKAWHKSRLEIKPGMTGLWQVVARSKTSFDDMVKLDMYYIDHQSIWLDLEIMLKTIPVMLLGKGGG